MAIEGVQLEQKYALTKINVMSSTQISAKTTVVLSRLTEGSKDKSALVSLTARSNNVSKLISIVEIAKRELASRNKSVFQYNALQSEMIDVPREKKKQGPTADANGGDRDESDDAFEPLENPGGATKKRSVPLMTIYLASVAVKELRAEYGEQK